MKRFVLLVLFLGIYFMPGQVLAGENANYYLPERNTYYERSQHTYSFYDSNGDYNKRYAPSIYVLLKNKEEAEITDIWAFTDKYSVPWKIGEDYDIAFCANVEQAILEAVPYVKVSLNDTDVIEEKVKDNLRAIINNSYPYISKDKMIENLIKVGVLEEKTEENKQIIIAKDNTLATESITIDELVTATQMAIYYYTNPNKIDKIYYSTEELTGRSVLKSLGLWKNEYTAGTYDAVEKNIMAVYNYLITLKENKDNDLIISDIKANKIDSNYELKFKFNKIVSAADDLKLNIYYKDRVIKEVNINDLKYDDGYMVSFTSDEDIKELKIKLEGTFYTNRDIFVYYDQSSDVSSQTLISASDGYINILDEKSLAVNSLNNPSTGVILSLSFGGILGALGIVLFKMKKPTKLFKI